MRLNQMQQLTSLTGNYTLRVINVNDPRDEAEENISYPVTDVELDEDTGCVLIYFVGEQPADTGI